MRVQSYSPCGANVQQGLIRTWDSERELFYDDIIDVEASAYAHWTDFLISTVTKHLRYAYQAELSEFVLPNRWIIAQIILIWS